MAGHWRGVRSLGKGQSQSHVVHCWTTNGQSTPEASRRLGPLPTEREEEDTVRPSYGGEGIGSQLGLGGGGGGGGGEKWESLRAVERNVSRDLFKESGLSTRAAVRLYSARVL